MLNEVLTGLAASRQHSETTLAEQRAVQGAAPRRYSSGLSRFSDLAPVLERNIEALHERRQREAGSASWQERAADAIARFIGSLTFVYLQLLFVGFWLAGNLHLIPRIRPWDKSFVILAMIASVEAIFLSTFVLITQNRMAAAADKRADLDLQISLLTEHEITKLTTLVSEVANKMGVTTDVDHELEEIKRDVAPEMVLDKIERKNTP